MSLAYAPDVRMRRVEPSHREWMARGYQQRASDFLCANRSAALFLRPGMGKTAITLRAFTELQEHSMAQAMLVVAPLRVCQLVWRQEAAKWSQFKHLSFGMMAGEDEKRRKKVLHETHDVYLVNPEGVTWLCDQFWGRSRLPFDTLEFDELTKFKNAHAIRSKKIRKFADNAPRRWGGTGTPIPNGYLDLFGQMLLLDGGASLGRYISHFRDKYFMQGRDGFTWVLRPGAKEQIEERIRPYVFYADQKDHVDMPSLLPNPIMIEMPKPAMKLYKDMKKDMIVSHAGETITAANAAGVYSKLKQMANGAVYTEHPKWELIHNAKLDALEELVEELSGEPLMVGYEFQHDLERILERFPNTPYIGSGVSGKEAQRIVDAWNRNEIPMLPCHPASMGHGLNMQEGGAHNFCWFSETIDAELWDQLIGRIKRSGNEADTVIMHQLIVKDTIDEQRVQDVSGKMSTQDRMLAALKSELFEGEVDMRRFGSPAAPPASEPAPAPAPQQTEKQAVRGWGAATQAAPAAAEQRATIGSKLTGGAPAPAAPAPAAQPVRGWNTAPAAEPAPQIRSNPEDRREPEVAGLDQGLQADMDRAYAGDGKVWDSAGNAIDENSAAAQALPTAPAPANTAKRTRTKPAAVQTNEAVPQQPAPPAASAKPWVEITLHLDVAKLLEQCDGDLDAVHGLIEELTAKYR